MFAPILPFPPQGCNAPHAPAPQFSPQCSHQLQKPGGAARGSRGRTAPKMCPELPLRAAGTPALCPWLRTPMHTSPSPLSSACDLEKQRYFILAPSSAPNPTLPKDSVIVLAESGGRAHNSLPPSPRLLPHDINFIYRLLDRRRLKEGKKGEGFYLLCQAATCF